MADRTLRDAERTGDLVRVLGTRLRQEKISYTAVEFLAWTHYQPAREVLGWPEGRFPSKEFMPLNQPMRLVPPWVAYPEFDEWINRLPWLGKFRFLTPTGPVRVVQWVFVEILYRITNPRGVKVGWRLAQSRVNAWLEVPSPENAAAVRSSHSALLSLSTPAQDRAVADALWLICYPNAESWIRRDRLIRAVRYEERDPVSSTRLDLSRLHAKILEVCGTA